jgi:hypothetical protein
MPHTGHGLMAAPAIKLLDAAACLWVMLPGDAGRTALLDRACGEAERAVAEA